MGIKLLFLDHDGVTTLGPQYGTRYKKREAAKEGGTDPNDVELIWDDFDPKAIVILNEIIDATDCEIVISSTWREHGTLEQIQELYLKRGIAKTPIGYTPVMDYNPDCSILYYQCKYREAFGLNRQHEILHWIESFQERIEIDNWVAVDDQPLGIHEDHFVQTIDLPSKGIKQDGIKELIIARLLAE